MSSFIYPTLSQAISTHVMTIEHSGGGVSLIRDTAPLEGVLEHIQNDDYYPTFADKLTHLFFCTCKFHCFADGNKRMAITLSAQFLLLNGHMAVAKTFFRDMENISYHVAAGSIDKELLNEIMHAILAHTYDTDEELKLKIFNAIS